MKFLTLLLAALLSFNTLLGQQPSSAITPLKEKLSELSAEENRTTLSLESLRAALCDATDSIKLKTEILAVERQLFTLQDSIRHICNRIAGLENSEYISSLKWHESPLDRQETSQYGNNEERYFIKNSFIKANLSQDDYKALTEVQEAERLVVDLINDITNGYKTIKELYGAYQQATNEESAMAIWSELQLILSSNRQKANTAEVKWSHIFNTKLYLYNYLADKSYKASLLAEMESAAAALVEDSASNKGRYMYDITVNYQAQKRLITEYELSLATSTGLANAADSLKIIQKAVSAKRGQLTKISPVEKSFIPYENITFGSLSKNKTSTYVENTAIYKKGIVYRILLGVYTKPQPIYTFMGTTPLSKELKHDNKYYYFAGSFASYADAASSVAELRKKGFRDPQIAAWNDGAYIGIVAPPPIIQTAGEVYRIEVATDGSMLNKAVREIVVAKAPDKEISRTKNQETQETVFSIGVFNNFIAAAEIIREIEALNLNIPIKIIILTN